MALKATTFTGTNWDESRRPILSVDEDTPTLWGLSLRVGAEELTVLEPGDLPTGVLRALEGYCEIFEAARNYVRGRLQQTEKPKTPL